MSGERGLRPVAHLWEWQRAAACRDEDASYFYSPAGECGPERRRREERARRVCRSCTVRETCALFALAFGERYGVWGGMTESERNKIAAARSAASGGG